MFARFASEWRARWDKHLHTPETQWDPLIEFFRLAQPAGPEQPYTRITRERWYRSLRRKKARAAPGPDGWSRKDLLQLPDDLTDAILQMLHQIEEGTMDWPQQWLVGIIHSLEKHDQPATVSGYRPITIFSLIYRNWASIRSKELLHHLSQQVSSYSFGNFPHRCTTHMWMCLQQEIETNHSNGLVTNGAVLDIVKCFNCMPRIPLFAVLHHMGAAAPMLRAWSSALMRMERRFAIRGSVGPPVKSTTGFAEGCSLSVCAMVAANQLIASWMTQKISKVRLISFVDNLELFSQEPTTLMKGVQALEDVLNLLDLQVDKSKTYLWSTTGKFRKVFLNHGFQVKTAARDIGAHVQYSRVATNFTITKKIEAFSDRWKSLALSPATYTQKLRALKAVSWPNMLHGIASAHLGDPWYEDMRTAALRALHEHKPGASPPLHLSLVEHPSADPGYYAIWMTLRQCRQYMTPEMCGPQFSRLSADAKRKRPEVGPCSVILHRLKQLYWQWDVGGFFRDEWNSPIDLWDCPIQELAYRTADAWRYKIACEVSSRHTMIGLSQCNAAFTCETLPVHTRDRAILRSALNGTFFTADHLKHRDTPGDTRCRFCLQEDSLRHRYWECPALDACREKMSRETRADIQCMPIATQLHGWFPAPSSLQPFRHMLDDLPSYDQCSISQGIDHGKHTGPVHYFTDGSCLRPADKFARICGWGVVRACPDDMWSFEPIAAGCLPGRHQTVVRAELLAATSAIHTALMEGHFFCLWTDNARVAHLLQAMVEDPERQWRNTAPNHDSINVLASVFREAVSLCKGIFKVASHQQTMPSTPTAERWCFSGNEAADAVATHAFHSQPALMQQWEQLCCDLDHQRSLRNSMHNMMISIGVECLTKTQALSAQKPAISRNKQRHLPMTPWALPEELPAEAMPYILSETQAMLHWIRTLQTGEHPVQRWSWWQIFLDAWLTLPNFGPWYHVTAKQWRSGVTQPSETFQRKARWFSKYLTKLYKACNVSLPLLHALPNGTAIAFWTATLPVTVAASRTAELDEWFGKFFPCASKTADLRKIVL